MIGAPHEVKGEAAVCVVVIMRRVIRATYLGKEPGDVSSLENPAAVKPVAETT